MSIEFPLLTKPSPVGPLPNPRIPVSIPTPAGRMTMTFLVDTGADFTMAPASLAERAGIDLSSRPRITCRGIGGTGVDGRLAPLPLLLGSEEVELRTVFTDREDTPLLLGRADLFDRFSILFDTDKGRILFIPRG